MTLDIECFDTSKDKWAQAKFLFHGIDDVYWSDSPEEIAKAVMMDLQRVLAIQSNPTKKWCEIEGVSP